MVARRDVAIAAAVPALWFAGLGVAVAVGWVQPDEAGYSYNFLGPVGAVVWFAMVATETRARRRVAWFTPLFVGLALTALVAHHGRTLAPTMTGESFRSWSVFHYYTGSKYFEELGYADLYGATVAADDDFLAAGGAPELSFAGARTVRDLRTYEGRPREEIAAEFDRSLITPERLAELGRDTRFMAAQERAQGREDRVRRVLMDLGYNPAPPWTLVGVPMARTIEPGGRGWALITSSDVWTHLVIGLALVWGFGLRTAAVALLWIHAVFFNSRILIGGFLNFDWLAATVLAVAAWHKGRPALAGTALAWAGMTRIFPGLLALPLVGKTAWDLVRRRRPDPALLRFTVVFCSLCALLLVGSHATGRGARTWPEWKDNIQLHTSQHARSGARRVGLGKLVRHFPSEKRFLRSPRNTTAEQDRTIHLRKTVATLLGFALLLAALRGRSEVEAMLLMLFAAWLLTTSSRYYASVWALMFVLPTQRSDGSASWPGVIAGGGIMAVAALLPMYTHSGARYLVLNYVAAAMFVALCVSYLRSRPAIQA